jgi:putative hydrolase of the HAD superfamily
MKITTDVFFDLDRTLWDFETNSDFALRKLFDDLNLQQTIKNKNQFIHDYNEINERLWDEYRKGLTTREELRINRFHTSFLLHGLDNIELASKYCELYIQNCPEQTITFPGTHEMLNELKGMGKRLHIITNGFSEVQYRKMTNCGIIDYFDIIICSDLIGVNKPDPKIFQIALQKANARPETSIMIGDHPEIDVLGANQVGMRGILFDPHLHYAHHPDMEKINNLMSLIPIVVGL